MDKFGRNYILLVQTQSQGVLTIQPPFTIEFDLTRNILNSANVASIRVYNLGSKNRNDIEFNIYDQKLLRTVQLFAGYGENGLPLIFSGNLNQAWSVREGVNFITEMQCFDGGFVYNNNTTNLHFDANTTNDQVIAALVNNLMPVVTPGKLAPVAPGKTQRGKSYSGNTTDILGQLTNGGFFIDNGKANVLGNSDCLQGNLQTINSSTGLLGTPVREQNIITFDILFEPRLIAGQLIFLDSVSGTKATANALSPGGINSRQAVNGYYKTTSVKHRGMISETVCGTCTTTLSMFSGGNGPDALSVIS